MSDSDAMGKLTSMPGIVEADATNPINESGVCNARAKGLSTGFFDIVELRIAKKPTRQSTENRRTAAFSEEIKWLITQAPSAVKHDLSL
jgi:hypothetical protein